MCHHPKFARDRRWVYAETRPPCAFVANSMKLAMVSPTERNCKFVAYFAAECSGLRKTQVMSIGRSTSANQTRLFRDESQVILVAETTRFRNGEHAFVDPDNWGRTALKRSLRFLR